MCLKMCFEIQKPGAGVELYCSLLFVYINVLLMGISSSCLMSAQRVKQKRLMM